jgi:membrane protease YdiL (CAAX protease family)
MKKFIFYLLILAAVAVAAYALAAHPLADTMSKAENFELLMFGMLALFLLITGAYGLYAEHLWKHFRAQGKHENLCVEANYYVRRKGFFGRLFLFPFIKIKSTNSLFIATLGALAWVIILAIVLNVVAGLMK